MGGVATALVLVLLPYVNGKFGPACGVEASWTRGRRPGASDSPYLQGEFSYGVGAAGSLRGAFFRGRGGGLWTGARWWG